MLFQCITFAPLIVEMIINGVNPVGACTNIGICLVGKQRLVPVVACELLDRNGALCPAAYVHRYLNRTLHHHERCRNGILHDYVELAECQVLICAGTLHHHAGLAACKVLYRNGALYHTVGLCSLGFNVVMVYFITTLVLKLVGFYVVKVHCITFLVLQSVRFCAVMVHYITMLVVQVVRFFVVPEDVPFVELI